MSGVTAQDVDDFARAIALHFGHLHHEARHADLRAMLAQRMAATASTTYRAYKARLEPGAPEWTSLAPLLTVPETYFFRMPSHFDALLTEALPKILASNRASRSLRILSAGCASGEEPYSLRMLLDEQAAMLEGWQVEIVGVDLSSAALERARAGLYSEWSLRATSAERKQRSFDRIPGSRRLYRLRAAARAGVEFRRENLMSPPAHRDEPFDVIFCRNVLIYFTEEAIRIAIDHLTERLRPGGFLFLGPAESLRGISSDYSLCQGADAFYYRRKQHLKPSSAASPEAPAAPPEGSWYASIQQSWERLQRLVPGAAAAATPRALPAEDRSDAFFSLVRAERFAQALDLLEAMRGEQDGQNLRLERASLLNSLGRTAEAEAECRKLLALDDTIAGAHYLLGLCREQAGDLAAAAAEMEAATTLDPAFAIAHMHRGMVARQRHDDAGAQTAFALALGTLRQEDPRRLALFGGGFSESSLRLLCERELHRSRVSA